ncbi:LPS export ABC transporter permease LptF [Methyloligella sp. 2.7D]|uniref:LPS export ABC transporter permease LptF n=1 Tax=unclassified Methyloligella TaxID=2625955 RepID=UPI00157E0E1C|nr:LPS export ABC transporter permease LptF [Methyloligella sp. GL2]QKP77476.1 LPS export ABC transporter permease LptF [Methyloligella sp. GL2]
MRRGFGPSDPGICDINIPLAIPAFAPLFSRYVFKQVLNAFALILLTLTMIVWMAMALRQLDLITSQGQGFILFLKMTLLSLPSLISLIAPNAVLMSALYTLDRMNSDSEIIVMTAAGATIWRICSAFLVLGVLVSIGILIINLYISPMAVRALTNLVTQVRTDLISQVLQPGRFSSPEQGLTFHIRDRDKNGDLLGLLVYDERDPGKVMTYLAERSRILKRGDDSYLVMFDGEVHSADAKEKEKGAQIIAFDQYMISIADFAPPGKRKKNVKPRQLYLGELLNPELDPKQVDGGLGKIRSELHERLSSPLYPFLFTLIAVTFLGHARTTRQGRWGQIMLVVGICVSLRLAGITMTNLVALNPWAAVPLYAIPIAAILVAAWVAHVRMQPELRSKLSWDVKFQPAKIKYWFARGIKAK